MSQITFIRPSGETVTVEGTEGMSIMEIAKQHRLDEIRADCGGSLACATCHAYIDWPKGVEPRPMADTEEDDMLDFVIAREASSRLTCQIKFAPNLSGLVVRLPSEQC